MKVYRNPDYIYRDEGDRIYAWSFDKGIFFVKDPLAEVIRYSEGKSIDELARILETDIKDVKEMINALKNKNLVLTEQPKINARYVVNKFRYPSTKTAPDGIFYEITYRCNMKCIYCYTESMPNSVNNIRKELTSEEVFKLIDAAADMGVCLLNIGGGEPLLREDIFDIISYAHERGLKTSLVTNGTLITREVANKLKSSGLDYIGLSLDGTKHYHDLLRGNYEKVLKAISILANEGFWIFINFVVTKLNVNIIEETIKIVKNLGVRRFRAIRLAPVGRGKNLRKLMLSPLEYLKFVKLLDELSDKYSDSDFYVYKDYSFLTLIKKPVEEYKARLEWLSSDYLGCPALRSFIFINPYGEIYPCGYLETPDFLLGNIRQRNLREIWEDINNPIIKIFRYMKNLNPICDNCFNRKYCGGGCRALAYSVFGDINAGDPYCPRYTTLRDKDI